MKADLFVDCQNELGEGIQWSVPLQRLFWTDINRNRLYSCDEFGDKLEITELPDRLCSFAFDPQGDLLCAFADGLYRYRQSSGARELLYAFEPEKAKTRLNDGRCDRAGRFIVGGYNEVDGEFISSVISYTQAGAIALIEQVKCTNGLAFSPDGTKMYFTDTATKKIWCYDYDPQSGGLSNKTLFAELDETEGSPDGSCVDAEGGLWNARFRGSSVQRYLPDGQKGVRIALPAPNVTCCCFGGAKLDKLYTTTARQKMTPQQLEDYPQAGGVFMVVPGVRGLAESSFGECLFP